MSFKRLMLCLATLSVYAYTVMMGCGSYTQLFDPNKKPPKPKPEIITPIKSKDLMSQFKESIMPTYDTDCDDDEEDLDVCHQCHTVRDPAKPPGTGLWESSSSSTGPLSPPIKKGSRPRAVQPSNQCLPAVE